MSPVKIKRGKERVEIVFAANLDADDAAAVYRQLQKALAGKAPIVVSAANVERLHTAIAQLVIAFWGEARSRGVTPSWGKTSPYFADAMRLLGLSSLVGLTA